MVVKERLGVYLAEGGREGEMEVKKVGEMETEREEGRMEEKERGVGVQEVVRAR